MIELKDYKSCQENVSVSLTKRKLHEKKKINGSFLTNQVRSCSLPYTSQIAEKASFLSVTILELHFIVANSVRLNLAVLEISEKSQERTRDGVLC